MYKKQLGFQKIVCLLAIIVAAVWFVYCLGMITDIHDALRYTMMNDKDRRDTNVIGSILFYDMQPFISQFQYYSIGLILLGCLLFITNTHNRRRYYIANYVSTALYVVATFALIVWTHSHIEVFTWRFVNEVDFAALLEESKKFSNIVYTESTLLLDAHYLVAALGGLVAVALLANMVWKIALMRGEKRLLNVGKEAA